MDPITAWALAVKAIAEMITEAMRGQSVEQRQKMWDWWITDQARWRTLLKLDAPASPPVTHVLGQNPKAAVAEHAEKVAVHASLSRPPEEAP